MLVDSVEVLPGVDVLEQRLPGDALVTHEHEVPSVIRRVFVIAQPAFVYGFAKSAARIADGLHVGDAFGIQCDFFGHGFSPWQSVNVSLWSAFRILSVWAPIARPASDGASETCRVRHCGCADYAAGLCPYLCFI